MDDGLTHQIVSEELSGDVINLFFDILVENTDFRPINVHLMGLWDAIEPIESCNGKFIQILPDRPTQRLYELLHWVTFCLDNGVLNVYDSMNRQRLTPTQAEFFDRLFPQQFLTIKFHHCDQQTNGIDCGVYAIAFATALALNQEPSFLRFSTHDMRAHLLQLLTNRVLSPFPTISEAREEDGTGEVASKKRGRPTLTEEQKLKNKEEQKERNRQRMQANRKEHKDKLEESEYAMSTFDLKKHAVKLRAAKLTDSPNFLCPHCHSKLFWEERDRKEWCCKKGSINKNIPEVRAPFYSNPKFLLHCRAFNNLFAFSAIGVSGGFQTFESGPSLVKVQGRVYHRIFDLSYKNSSNNSVMYIDDGKMRRSVAEEQKLDLEIVKQISDYMNAVNPFIPSLRRLSSEEHENAHIVFEKTSRKTHGPVLGDQPRSDEISAILSTSPESDPRKVIIWKLSDRKPQFIHFLDPSYECLQYPLLFPHGTAGWSIEMKDENGRKLSQIKYYRYLLLSEPRFTNIARLGQEYFVDMWCRVEEDKLQFLKFKQNLLLRVATKDELQEFEKDETIMAEGGLKAGKTYLPSSFTHGRRYMQLKYQDGMAMISRKGKPTYFITVTCNPNWPEIKENLNKNQSAIDRPDLTCRVFELKLRKLVELFKEGVLFGKMAYYMYVIEYQKRGLPHAHIAMRVEGGGPQNPSEVDRFVRATIPEENEFGGQLRDKVLTHMIHGPCGIDNPSAPCTENSRCTKNYPMPIVSDTYHDERGYVHYRRPSKLNLKLKNGREINDQWVVPYNPNLLMIWNGHCNVEISNTVKIIKYMCKYIHKGPDRVKVAVVPEIQQNEIEEYAENRIISASEAMWRIFEFTNTSRFPTVEALPVHLEGKEQVVFREGQEKEAVEKYTSKLQFYFHRPRTSEFEHLTYLDFYEKYIVGTKNTKYTIFEFPDHKHFLHKRQRGECICRMFWLSPTLGEVYYLRLLLTRFSAYGYEELKTVNGQKYATFQEAARGHGLLTDEYEFRDTLSEAAGFKTANELRSLFLNLIMSGAPAAVLWNDFKEILAEDYLETFGGNQSKAFNRALMDIDRLLRYHGKTTVELGLPDVCDDSNEVSREYLRWDKSNLANFINYWESKLNDIEQKPLYTKIVSHILKGNSGLQIYLDGFGGTGKTVLLRLIAAKLRYEGKIVLCVASTGIAALNYEGGCTAHSMFKIPVEDLHHFSVCNISNRSQRAELIRQASLIMWDEVLMSHKIVIESVDRTVRDVTDNKSFFFGNKNLLFAGDFRQIPPVIKNASSETIITSTFKFSYAWEHLEKVKLTISQRNKSDPSFSEELLAIGEGRANTVHYAGEDVVPLTNFKHVQTVQELINFVYPEDILDDVCKISKRAILSSTNKSIDEINKIVLQNKIQGPQTILYSADSVGIEEGTNPENTHISADLLNKLSEPGIPDHELKIKIGALCILIRNLNFEDGLVNGTKIIIRRIFKFSLEVTKPEINSKTYLIPRVMFKFTTGKKGVEIMRRQYPIKLAYALTINKSQGQTLDVVGVDLREHLFAHGQLYVALSRARQKVDICLLTKKERFCNNVPTTRNVVYDPLLS